MSETAFLSEGLEISVPRKILDAQGWRAGQEFAFLPKGDGVLLQPVPRIDELRGIAKGADPTGYRDRNDGNT